MVVNCSGLGAAKLFKDPEMYPVRGHVIRVRAPWIKYATHPYLLSLPDLNPCDLDFAAAPLKLSLRAGATCSWMKRITSSPKSTLW